MTESTRLRRQLGKLILLSLFLLVLALSIFWTFSKQSISDMWEALRGAQPGYYLLALGCYFLSVLVWSVRLQVTCSVLENPPSLRMLYPTLLATIFLNNITPAMRVGGDPFFKAYTLHKKQGISYSHSMAVSIAEHFFDPLVVFSFLFLGFLLGYLGDPALRILFLILLVSSVLGWSLLPKILVRRRTGMGLASRILKRFGKSSAIHKIESFYTKAEEALPDWRAAIKIGALTLILWLTDMLRLCLVVLSVGYQPHLPMLLVTSSLPSIAGLFSIFPGGLVFVEGSLTLAFALFGLPVGVALAATLVERSISLLISSLVGAGCLGYLGLSFKAPR